MTGIPFPVFTSGGNKAPEKPFANIMAVNALKGQTRIHDVTFAGFSSVGSGETESRDYMITTSKGNDDLQHPVYTSGLNIEDSVDLESYVFYHDKINPSDCVDMDCDAMKKAMVVDEDGSLLGGTGGYVLPNAGFEWNGDPRRGIGDYRIPTGLDGSLLDMNVVAPYKGIYGFQDCDWREGWNAYDCDNSVDYALLLIESMDDDTLTRRLSPVAVHAGLYVDLINGPQDHGWCVGYTCRERLSTFPAIVALDVWSHLYMSSLTPDTLRFMLLGLEDDQCVGLSIFTTDSHRLDLYVDSIEEANYVLPLNMKVTAGRYFAKPETTPDQYMPDLTQKQNGANYMKFQQNTMYWVQCGKGELYIHRAEVIIVSLGLPAMDDEEFFGENLVNNIAQFLNVDVTKVRVVNVVRETTSQSGASRRKRSSDVTYFTVEISDTPTDHSSPVDLDGCADQIITQVQLYGMDTLINTTVLYTAILEHSSTPGAEPTVLQKVGSMLLTSHPFDGRENRPFRVQPVLKVHDENDDVVNYLGAINTPWQIEASIKSGSDDQASLTGETVATFVHGIAEFSDLGVDRPGDYVIEFKVIHPAEATNYTLETNLIRVENRLLEVQGEIHTPDGLVNSPLHVSLSLVEPHLGSLVSDIEWRNHTWAVTASISDPDVYDGTLTGVTSSTIDPATGKAHFLDLRLSRSGICPVKFTVTSTPAEYVLEKVLEIAVLTSAQRNLPREKSSELQIKFPIPFDVNTAPLYAIKVRNFLSDWFGIVVTSHSYMEGTTDGVDSAIDNMCGFISNGTTFTFGGSAVAPSPYLTVNGRQYYGVSCGPVDKDDGLHPGIIAAIVIACVVLILLLVVVLLWKLKVYPRTKTYDTNNSKYVGGRSDTIEDILFREDTFVSLKSRGSANTPLPPVTTSAPIRLWSPRGDIPTLPRTPEPGKPRPVTPVDPETQSNERLSFSGPKPIQPPLGENGRPPWRN
ncbi:hypothetical protein BaRGS_00036747 [Batillaria attramentaria]|uniref:Uncharacterized protein n=1 Tax=Batillaria attramentaria TaxID=370345 RepID=A0ABD0JB65_9CAEN